MQVGRSEGVEPRGLPDGAGKFQKAGPAGGPVRKADQQAELPDAQLAEYTRVAASSAEINKDAVREARALLESGRLASPEALQRTAEAILRLGI